MKIDYFRAALEWEENPQRKNLLDAIEKVILFNNISPEFPLNMRRSLAGNKRELYETLVKNDPARAQLVLRRAKNTKLEKLLLYFDKEIRSQKKAISKGG